jgi:hypothetical protein
MLLPLILSVYLLSHLNPPIIFFFALTNTPAHVHAQTVHRWGSLATDHAHAHAGDYTRLEVPTIEINTNTNANSHALETDLNTHPELPGPPPSTEPSQPLALAPDKDGSEDDWLKWHHERHLQQDMRRKLDCWSVEFGRCDIQSFRRRRRVETKNVVADDGHEKQRQEDEFVGQRLPRNLQNWLAREGGGGS